MILGLTGTLGAGKGAVVEHLVATHDFRHFSVREFLLEEIRRRGSTDETRTAMRDMGNMLRKEHGPDYIAKELLARAKASDGNAVIESIRSVGEAEYLKKNGAFVVAVDADKERRYERAVLRGSSTDKLSFEEFVLQENREMAGTEPWDMNVFGVMKIADYTLTNDGTLTDLDVQVDKMLQALEDHKK